MNQMKMFKKVLITATIALGATIAFATQSHAADYVENNEFNLPAGAGDSRLATPNYIILHETANATATGRNEATYMRNNWRNAYTTHIVGDGGIVYNVGQVGYVSWGALNANPYAPAQIELQHTYNRDTFNKNYRAYISLARNMAKRFNIPLTLDGAGRGIKSHLWVTQNFGGDHTDPYGYLAEMGVSKAKLASDLANGIGGSDNNVTPDPTPQPENPKPSSPYTVKAWNKTNKADGVVNIRTAQNTKAGIIGQLKAGQTFNATRVTTNGESVNGYNTWFEVNGRGWVSGALVTEVKTPAVDNSFHSENATFVTGGYINIRSNPSLSASIVGVYAPNQSFNYDGYKVADGYVWAHYTAYSGASRWVAVRNANTKVALGTFY
nr:MAG TPA: Endolysin [Caudoviricetes sp.]